MVSDSDCQPGLKCMQRGAFENVPGWYVSVAGNLHVLSVLTSPQTAQQLQYNNSNGSGAAGRDYCFDPSMTEEPTDKPTPAPVTAKPTSMGLGDPYYKLMIRLYWSIEYFWQETKEETWWCMECTKCNEYSLGDGPDVGCETPGSSSTSCEPGHLIWIRKCKDTRRKFEWNIVNNQGSGDQIRAAGTNMCLHTVDKRYLEIQPCDNTKSEQLFTPIATLEKFELRPYYQRAWSRDEAVCLTQMHHPKVRCKYVLNFLVV